MHPYLHSHACCVHMGGFPHSPVLVVCILRMKLWEINAGLNFRQMSFTHKNSMIPFVRAAELSSRAGSWEEPSWPPCQIKFSSASGGWSLCILSVRTPTLLKWTRGMCLALWIEAKDVELKPLHDTFSMSPPFLPSYYLTWWCHFGTLGDSKVQIKHRWLRNGLLLFF